VIRLPRHALEALGGRAPVVAVTGAASGIGLALVRKLRGSGYRTVATARAPSLHRLAREGFADANDFRLLPLDVTEDRQRRRLVKQVEKEWGGIDILINNAGIAFRGVVEHMSEEEELLQQATNYLGPMALCRLVLPHMRRQRWGRILNVSSVGGMMAMPTMAVYSASKWALEGAHEALWYEVRPWGIHVSLVQPGFVRSSGFKRVRHTIDSDRSEHDEDDAYHAHYAHMAPFIAKLMARSKATPDSIARKILRTMRRRDPPLRVPATADAWFFTALRRYLPRRLYHWILERGLPGIDEWGPD